MEPGIIQARARNGLIQIQIQIKSAELGVGKAAAQPGFRQIKSAKPGVMVLHGPHNRSLSEIGSVGDVKSLLTKRAAHGCSVGCPFCDCNSGIILAE